MNLSGPGGKKLIEFGKVLICLYLLACGHAFKCHACPSVDSDKVPLGYEISHVQWFLPAGRGAFA